MILGIPGQFWILGDMDRGEGTVLEKRGLARKDRDRDAGEGTFLEIAGQGYEKGDYPGYLGMGKEPPGLIARQGGLPSAPYGWLVQSKRWPTITWVEPNIVLTCA